MGCMTQKNMKKIKLTKGYEATVDDEDFEFLLKFKWQYVHGYATTAVYIEGSYHKVLCPKGKYKGIPMHRMVLSVKDNLQVDHINMNGLDNRKSNLRVASTAENMRNRGKQINNTSGYKGIGWDTERKKWRVQLKAGDIRIMKRFINLVEAQNFYRDNANIYHKEFARIT